MKRSLISRLSRWFTAVAAAALLAAALPQAGFAASAPVFTFTAIQAGETVTVHGQDFPKDTEFTVRMDTFGDLAINGIIVGTINTGPGSFDVTFVIPAELKDDATIAMRMDSASGWYSYNWFNNQTNTAIVAPVGPVASGKPYIDILAVKKNDSITVQANRFPAYQTFTIRVGPFSDFFKKYVVVGTLNSGSGGSFKFNVQLPDVVDNVDMITIRLDSSSGAYAFNAFKNVDLGTVTPIVTPIPVTGASCQITSTSPTGSLKPREDFDAVWTVKNTSSQTWDMHSVDYKYVSGSEMHKYAKTYDFKQTVQPGESVKIVVDMLAPSQTGVYSTNWAIVQSGATLCNLPLTVVVR